MALLKSTTLPTGVTAAYWRVNGLRLDFDSNTAHLSLGLYVDAAARAAGSLPVEKRDVGLPIAPWKGAGDPRAVAYEVLKESKPYTQSIPSEVEGEEPTETTVETNWFADAKDV